LKVPYLGSGISLIVGKGKCQSFEEFGLGIESTDIDLREISKASRDKAYCCRFLDNTNILK
jgi:hypothetical protein